VAADLSITLHREASAATVGRRAVHGLFDGAVDHRRLGDLALIVSELVTNAIVHGRAPITMTATLFPGEVLLTVIDSERQLPVQRPPLADAEDGRGVLIVGTLSSEWSVAEHADGKTVTARVPL
jgi:anti-sigma regulatory factor (Ser/Thr protein kinase)